MSILKEAPSMTNHVKSKVVTKPPYALGLGQHQICGMLLMISKSHQNKQF
jgi:hypothetical protein